MYPIWREGGDILKNEPSLLNEQVVEVYRFIECKNRVNCSHPPCSGVAKIGDFGYCSHYFEAMVEEEWKPFPRRIIRCMP